MPVVRSAISADEVGDSVSPGRIPPLARVAGDSVGPGRVRSGLRASNDAAPTLSACSNDDSYRPATRADWSLDI